MEKLGPIWKSSFNVIKSKQNILHYTYRAEQLSFNALKLRVHKHKIIMKAVDSKPWDNQQNVYGMVKVFTVFSVPPPPGCSGYPHISFVT